VSPDQLLAEARGLAGRGVPFRHQGRSDSGVDCVGLVLVCLHRVGVLPAEFERQDYGRLSTGELLARVERHCRRLPSATPGCMVLIRWPRDRRPSHVGLYTSEGNLIHCYAQQGRVVEHGFRAPWDRLADSFWALPGVRYV
jgi:cell wall-associated NlpC family hydrolase